MDCLFLMGPTWTLFDYFRSFQIINTAFRSYSLNVLRGFEQAEVGHFSILSTVGIYLIRVWYTANVFVHVLADRIYLNVDKILKSDFNENDIYLRA